jgi:hypothetical protein
MSVYPMNIDGSASYADKEPENFVHNSLEIPNIEDWQGYRDLVIHGQIPGQRKIYSFDSLLVRTENKPPAPSHCGVLRSQ